MSEPCMNSEAHMASSLYKPLRDVGGGQELILDDIAACLDECDIIWLPFYSTGTLAARLTSLGHDLIVPGPFHSEGSPPPMSAEFDAVYFGTPTIVAGQVLFPHSVPDPEAWTVERERAWVREACVLAINAGARRIVSGLGSGDVSPADRLEDMGGGGVVCMKVFDGFQDYVLVRDVT